jgi:very-short-patch-repair endonuclease
MAEAADLVLLKKRADMQRYSHEEFLQRLPEIFKQEYDILEEYKGIHTKIKFRHKTCGTEFEKTPNNIISNNQLCPFCFSSNGEKKIYIYLKENNINFYHNYIHPKMERNLRMDFFLYDKNMVIEFDGKQHYEINEYFGGKKEFLKTQERDLYKNHFCKENNIEILRLTKSDDVKKVLNSIFKVQRLSHGDEISQQE